MRLIDANKLLDIIDNINPVDYGGIGDYKYHGAIRDMKFDFEQIVANQPTVETDLIGWTPISEGLPEDEDATYLVQMQNQRGDWIEMCSFARDLYKCDEYDFYSEKGISGFYTCDSEWGKCKMRGVVAWRPMVKPYKGDKD